METIMHFCFVLTSSAGDLLGTRTALHRGPPATAKSQSVNIFMIRIDLSDNRTVFEFDVRVNILKCEFYGVTRG